MAASDSAARVASGDGATRSVQFVSKPIEPPYRDGTKCLVRDLCLHLRGVSCHVLTTGAPLGELEHAVTSHPIYGTGRGAGGGYSPGLGSNLRAAAWLSVAPAPDLWHFVFAPNPRSSQVGKLLRRLRRVPTVQTIASPPREFAAPERLLFGDRLVAQSHWTRTQFERAFADEGRAAPRIDVIFPPAPQVTSSSPEAVRRQLAELGLVPGAPLFLYPGDLEVSSGARRALELATALEPALPEAVTVLAYRRKTARAELVAGELRRGVDPARVKIVADVGDIHALVQAATAVVFPVDDLYGKVDLPIVLLEALTLGTPVLALNQGPLTDLAGATLLGPEPASWRDAALQVAQSASFRGELAAQGKHAVAVHFSAEAAAARYSAIYQSLW